MLLARELNLLLIALTFYTRISLLQPKHYSAELLTSSNRYLPVIGLFVGLLVGLVGHLSLTIFPVSISAWLVVFTSLWVTGAFHEDGLADTCDAMGAWSVESRLRIMKDSHIGAYGCIALIFSVGIRALFWAALPVEYWIPCAILVHSLSRLVPLIIMRCLTYVRDEQSSKVKTAGKQIGVGNLLISLTFTLIIAATFALSFPPLLWLVIVVSLTLLVAFLIFWFGKFLGGYTGDLLGASQQISEWTLLAVLVVNLS